MRDPNKNVSFVFYCYERESADLKIRLRYDSLAQSEFFRSILKMYVNQDPLILPVVEKIKQNKKVMGRKKLKSTSKDYKAGASLLEDLGVTKIDKENIFDIIEAGGEHYE